MINVLFLIFFKFYGWSFFLFLLFLVFFESFSLQSFLSFSQSLVNFAANHRFFFFKYESYDRSIVVKFKMEKKNFVISKLEVLLIKHFEFVLQILNSKVLIKINFNKKF